MEPHNQEVEIIPQRVGHGLNCRGGWGREIFATLRLNNFYLVPCCAFHIGPEKKGFQLLGDERGWYLTFLTIEPGVYMPWNIASSLAFLERA